MRKLWCIVWAFAFSASMVACGSSASSDLEENENGSLDTTVVNEDFMNMSYSKEAYPDLSAEEYANFRVVETSGMGRGVLYRSSSPISPNIGRNLEADSLSKNAGIAVFINLADSESDISFFEGYAESYYATQKVAFLGVPADYTNDAFKEGLAEGLRFMAQNEGPYLVHCTYGKDRTGFSIAVLEALMGATMEEIKEDFLKTYTNFYNVVDGRQIPLTESQQEYVKGLIANVLGLIFADFGDLDLASAAEAYLLTLGLSQSEIEALKARLGGE